MSYENSWQNFFKPGDRVIALPCWRKPRLYILSKDWEQRWHDSEFYPAFRFRARLFRLGLRIFSAAGFLPSRRVCAATDLFVSHLPADIARMVVLAGVEGPTQKLIVRCVDLQGRALAYIKYGELPQAVARIRKEEQVLNSLPAGLAPSVLWFCEEYEFAALTISAVEGAMLPAELPENPQDHGNLKSIGQYLDRLEGKGALFHVDEHPAIVRLRNMVEEAGDSEVTPALLDRLLVPLRNCQWPVVIQHGDFTPWNILCSSEVDNQKPGNDLWLNLCAIDWEEGNIEGFPYFDRIYYILQAGFLINRFSPNVVSRYAVEVLIGDCVDPVRGLSLVQLAAMDAFVRFGMRTGDKAALLQQFRREIICPDSDF